MSLIIIIIIIGLYIDFKPSIESNEYHVILWYNNRVGGRNYKILYSYD